MRKLSLVLTTAVLSFGVVGYSQQPAGGQAPQPAGEAQVAKEDAAGVAKLRDQYVELYNKGDARGLAQLFAQDAVLINPQGQTARGRGQIEKMLTEELTGPSKGARLQVKSQGSRTFAQNAALDYGTFQITGAQPTPAQKPAAGQAQAEQAQPAPTQTGQPQTDMSGHYLVVLSRQQQQQQQPQQQQQWLIEALHGAAEPQRTPGQPAPR